MEYMIYPFSEKVIPIVEYIERYQKYSINKYVCPNAWKDRINTITDKNLETNYDKALSETDGVIICDISEYSWLYKDTVKKTIKAISAGKDVICSFRIKDKDLEIIKHSDNYSDDRFHYLVRDLDIGVLNADYLKRIDGIIIGVGKLLEGLDSSTTLYSLYNVLKEYDYSVAMVGCSPDCYLMDGYEYPLHIFDMAEKNSNKVLLINDYINQIQKKQCADIIIVQFPGSLMKYSNELYGDFGVDSFILSKALSVDYFVTNVPVDGIDKNGFDGISDAVKNQYLFDIDSICVDSKLMDYSHSVESGKMEYDFADNDSVEDYVRYTEEYMDNKIIIAKNNQGDYRRIVDDCIEQLS